MATPAPVGRPTQLNEAMHKGIVEAVRGGLPITKAAALCGMHPDTVMKWQAIGRKAQRMADDGEEVPERMHRYARFSIDIEMARAEAQQVHLANIKNAAADGNWTASAWYLERTDPANWGRKDRLALTGGDGGPIEVEHRVSPKDTLAEKLSAMAERASQIIDANVRDDEPPSLKVAQ